MIVRATALAQFILILFVLVVTIEARMFAPSSSTENSSSSANTAPVPSPVTAALPVASGTSRTTGNQGAIAIQTESTPFTSSGVQANAVGSASHGIQCGVATEGVPAQGISSGCDSLLQGNFLRYGYGYDGCSYNKGYQGPQFKTPYCLPSWGELFNLVDEPPDYVQAASDWMAFADKWSVSGSSFRQLVALGRVTTPGATGSSTQIVQNLQTFFNACSGCDDPSSNRYIGTISFHAFANTNTDIPSSQGGSGVAPFASNVQYILDTIIPALAETWPTKRLAMTNFGVLGSASTAADEVAILYEFFNKYHSSPAAGKLDYLYYFAAQDYCNQAWNPPNSGCAAQNSLCEPGIAAALNALCN